MNREYSALAPTWLGADPDLESLRDRGLLAVPVPDARDLWSNVIESTRCLRPSARLSCLEPMQAVFARLSQ